MKVAELKKNAAPWFVLLVLSLALASSPGFLHSCLRSDPLPDSPAPFFLR
jgi:hypothetical protein